MLIDGSDSHRKAEVVHRLLLDRAGSPTPNQTQEIVLLEGGALRGTLVRDRNDTVYRVDDRRAVVDEALTAVVRQAHQRDGPVQTDAGDLYRRPTVIRDPIAFSAMIGRALEATGDLRGQQQATDAVLISLARATGDADVDGAIDRAAPESLRNVLRRMREATRETDRILRTLSGAAAALAGIANTADALHPLADTLPVVTRQRSRNVPDASRSGLCTPRGTDAHSLRRRKG